MRKLKNLLCLAIIATSLLFPGVVSASDRAVPLLDDQVVVGGTFTLEAGEELDGSLIVVGGVVSLEPGSIVTKDMLVFGGNVTVEGRLMQNLVAFGGVVVLTETAEIYGDLIAPATVIRKNEEARIYGQVIADTEALDINFPEIDQFPVVPDVPEPGFLDRYLFSFGSAVQPAVSFIMSLVWSFALAALSILVLIILPKQTNRVSYVVQESTVTAGGLGILTAVISIPLMAITAITLFLIPATVAIFLAVVLGAFFGIIAVGNDLGRRIASGFGYEWRPPLQIAVGTFAIAFLISIFNIAHLDGLAILLWIVVGGIGLGAVVLTRFGTREHQSSDQMVTTAAAIVEADTLDVEDDGDTDPGVAETEAEPKTGTEKPSDEAAE